MRHRQEPSLVNIQGFRIFLLMEKLVTCPIVGNILPNIGVLHYESHIINISFEFVIFVSCLINIALNPMSQRIHSELPCHLYKNSIYYSLSAFWRDMSTFPLISHGFDFCIKLKSDSISLFSFRRLL